MEEDISDCDRGVEERNEEWIRKAFVPFVDGKEESERTKIYLWLSFSGGNGN